MTQANIDYIIKLKEFKDLLSIKELIELSMCAKNFRMSLSSEVFRSLSFDRFVEAMGYKSSVIKRGESEFRSIESLLMGSKAIENNLNSVESDDSNAGVEEIQEFFGNESDENESQFSDAESSDSYKDFECVTSYIRNPFIPLTGAYLESKYRFQSDINKLRNQPKKLKVFSVNYHSYLICDLASRLSNVKILSISWSEIRIDDFQLLLDNLTFLEELDFDKNILIKRRTDSNSYSINWPLNLKKFKFNKSEVGYINDTEVYFKDELRESLNAEFVEFELYPMLFPNLKSLALLEKKGYYNYEISNHYFNFLKENIHVKELNLGYPLVKPELFEIIRNFSNLTKLKLSIPHFQSIRCFNNTYQNIRFSDIKEPVLCSIKSLDITYHGDPSNFDYIAKHYPNVVNLIVDLEFEYFSKLDTFISTLKNFKHLTNLKLKFILLECEAYELKFCDLKSLKSIEFLWYSDVKLRDFSWSANSCPNLRIVKFSGPNLNSPKLITELSSNWNISYSPNKISFYRKRKKNMSLY